MTIELIAGARPNFMKVAPVLRALADRNVTARLVHTGQHYDAAMSDVFFEQLGIPRPDVHLGVGSGAQGEQTAKIIAAYEQHLLGLSSVPAGVVVVGDVNSTMACTLAATKLGVPVAHVEAGLRSFDRTMPEEINRLVTDVLADVLLASEPSGVQNLLAEGVNEDRVHLVGNVMIDTLKVELPQALELRVPERLGLQGPYGYVTLHRPSNVDDESRLGQLVELLGRIVKRVPLVLPAHPRTRARLESFGLLPRLEAMDALHLLEPVGYREGLSLMAGARVILTDSGGIQEESTHLDVPCLTVRPNTERPITVERGTSTLVGEALDRIEPLVDDALEGRYKRSSGVELWDGQAAGRIVEVLGAAWSLEG